MQVAALLRNRYEEDDLARSVNGLRLYASDAYTLSLGPWFHDQIGLWDCGKWKMFSLDNGTVDVTVATAKDVDNNSLSEGTYDVFAYPLSLYEVGLALKRWGSPTSRGYSLNEFEGRLTRSSSYKNYLYIGVYYHASTGYVLDTYYSRFVANYFNPIMKCARGWNGVYTSTNFWTYSDSIWRESNDGTNQYPAKFVLAFPQNVHVTLYQNARNSSGDGQPYIGVALNNITTITGGIQSVGDDDYNYWRALWCDGEIDIDEGYNYVTTLEKCEGSSSQQCEFSGGTGAWYQNQWHTLSVRILV